MRLYTSLAMLTKRTLNQRVRSGCFLLQKNMHSLRHYYIKKKENKNIREAFLSEFNQIQLKLI